MWESSGSLFFFVLRQLTVAERDTVELLLFHFLYFYQGFFYFNVFFYPLFGWREGSALLTEGPSEL